MQLRRILPVAVAFAIDALAQSDPWAPLRVFEGKWEGPTSGKPGKGSTTREFRFEMNGRFRQSPSSTKTSAISATTAI